MQYTLADEESDDARCGGCCLFSGTSGHLVVLTLGVLAFTFYTCTFALRRRAGRETRSWKVFWLDLAKIGLGQISALGVNMFNSHRNAQGDFDPLSWYFPTFINDELIAVPLGVGIWHGFLYLVRTASGRWPNAVWLQALRASGRYHPAEPADLDKSLLPAQPSPACGLLGSAARACGRAAEKCCVCARSDPEVRYDWWLVQLVFWLLIGLCPEQCAPRSNEGAG